MNPGLPRCPRCGEATHGATGRLSGCSGDPDHGLSWCSRCGTRVVPVIRGAGPMREVADRLGALEPLEPAGPFTVVARLIFHVCERCGDPTQARGNYCPTCAPVIVEERWADLEPLELRTVEEFNGQLGFAV